MKRIGILLLALLLSLSAGAQHFSGLSVRSYRIASAWPVSFRAVQGSVEAEIGNSGEIRSMSGITATVYRNGQRFAHGTCDDVTFLGGTRNYVLQGRVELADGISVLDAILAAFDFHVSEYTLDIAVDVSFPGGRTEHVKRSGVPLAQYLKR